MTSGSLAPASLEIRRTNAPNAWSTAAESCELFVCAGVSSTRWEIISHLVSGIPGAKDAVYGRVLGDIVEQGIGDRSGGGECDESKCPLLDLQESCGERVSSGRSSSSRGS